MTPKVVAGGAITYNLGVVHVPKLSSRSYPTYPQNTLLLSSSVSITPLPCALQMFLQEFLLIREKGGKFIQNSKRIINNYYNNN